MPLFLVLVALALNVSAISPQTPVTALHAVQKIYVEGRRTELSAPWVAEFPGAVFMEQSLRNKSTFVT